LAGARLTSSASNQVREQRAALLGELTGVHVVDDRAGDIGRQQIGRELDALERRVERLRQGLDQQRLGEPRHAFDQAVAAGQ